MSTPSPSQSTITGPACLWVISGPSGAGKGTLCDWLCAQHPEWYWSISATTRAPRAHETHGREYLFWTDEQFRQAIAEDGLIEWAVYNNCTYGTPKAPILERLARGQSCLLEIEVQGALQLKAQFGSQAQFIFIAPPSIEVLRSRLTARQTNTADDIENRLSIAQEELAQQHLFDAVIVNDDLATTKQALAKRIATCL